MFTALQNGKMLLDKLKAEVDSLTKLFKLQEAAKQQSWIKHLRLEKLLGGKELLKMQLFKTWKTSWWCSTWERWKKYGFLWEKA